MENVQNEIESKGADPVVRDGYQVQGLPGEGTENALSRTLKGLGASPGLVEGPVKVYTNWDDLDDIAKETILVSPTASRELGTILSKVSGLATERGGILAIAAGWARELGVPAVVGAGNLLESVKDGDRIRINGWEGTVEILPG